MENFALYYHDRTKHLPWRYARSLGYLDWDTQPHPFRFWEGARQVELPFVPDPPLPYENLYIPPEGYSPFNLESISKFLELALGLSAWKSAGGSTWAVRMNPSSGNLHPTEGYLIVPDSGGLSGVYHYNPYLHVLEKVRDVPEPLAEKLKNHFRTEGFILVLTSIPWRESWKYGERAYRYCLLDVGHAVGSVRFSANLQGWKVKVLNTLGDKDIASLIGLNKVDFPEGEEEYPELALFVFLNNVADVPRDIPDNLIKEFEKLPFLGKPNLLSPERVIWEIVYKAFERLEKPRTSEIRFSYGKKTFRVFVNPKLKRAPEIIRKRRSGHIYDPSVMLTEEAFYQILERTLPADNLAPFDVELSPTYVNLVIFANRILGLPKGLYLFLRNEEHLKPLKEHLRNDFLWKEMKEGLYLLAEGDFSREAGYLSCMQDIASDGAFAVAMISPFEPIVREKPWEYRTIHYEAGLVGQVLYIEATALGIKGTGIGCFFDDLTHRLLGLASVEPPLGGNLLETRIEVDRTFQVVYHFTVGRAFEDPRLETLPPYHHLRSEQFK